MNRNRSESLRYDTIIELEKESGKKYSVIENCMLDMFLHIDFQAGVCEIPIDENFYNIILACVSAHRKFMKNIPEDGSDSVSAYSNDDLINNVKAELRKIKIDNI